MYNIKYLFYIVTNLDTTIFVNKNYKHKKQTQITNNINNDQIVFKNVNLMLMKSNYCLARNYNLIRLFYLVFQSLLIVNI